LLGPRRVGKSQLISHELNPDFIYDLLEADTFREISARPQLIRERLKSETKLVVIDEIQKLPLLMDEVHSMIEKTDTRFLLTGSSARKLKKSYTSLLAGRASQRFLTPFVSIELKEKFELNRILQYGALPPVYLSKQPKEELRDYVGLYLKEEIVSEALVRRIDNFSRFIEFAALTNGQILNFESLGSDSQVSPRTVREYYSILKDTLVGYMLEPIRTTNKRKSSATSKFFFFDIGVTNMLTGRKLIPPRTKEYEEALEHFIFLELMAYKIYNHDDVEISFWHIPREAEVDFIINEEIGIEVKASTLVSERHLSGFRAYSKYDKLKRRIIVCHEKYERKMGDVEIIPINIFLQQLWSKGF
ncbi:MAG: hypothetical protein A2Z20_05200, partial [Bdellovibrionales bacterium RBG_16_40_8]